MLLVGTGVVYILQSIFIVGLLLCCTGGCHLLLPLEPGPVDAAAAPTDVGHDVTVTDAPGDLPLDAPADITLDREPVPDRPVVCTPVAGTTTKAEMCLSAQPPAGSMSLWPTVAGSAGVATIASCDWIDGLAVPAAGPYAANWFVYGGCGDWKEYQIGEGCQLRVKSYSSGCPPEGVPKLAEVVGVVEEWDGATWQLLRTIKHGTVTQSCTQVFESPTTPITPSFFSRPARVRVRQTGDGASGFLICVYTF